MKKQIIEDAEYIEIDADGQAIDKIKQFNNATLAVENGLAHIAVCTGNLSEITNSITQLAQNIAIMDRELDFMLGKMRTDLETFKTVAPIVERQLQQVSNRMDVILNKLILNDFSSLKAEDIETRHQLIQLMSDQNDLFCDMFLKLMTK